MNLNLCFLLLCATSYASATSKCSENIDVDTSPIEGLLGTMLEMLLDRFDDMERKLSELQIVVNEIREEMERTRVPECVSPTTSPPQLETTTSATTTQPAVTETPSYASCQDVPFKASEVYLIRINNDSSPFKVYCEMESFGGGWIVVQHRFDGSVDFYLDWDQYREGFGELDNEFWLGLERIHQLTTARAHEIVIEMKDFSDNYGYARYDQFKIESESEEYRLTIGGYSGTAGDAMAHNNNKVFQTKDRDANNCAKSRKGAWWYDICTRSNLNGLYQNVTDLKSMYWIDFLNDFRGMSFSRMMIREL
uniref:Putative ficolin n=1 Tax=Anopheles marajoara TaxID=58244 RepID=A0A2M4BVV1_9DIPT